MEKFEINKVYAMNSICDSDCWWYYRVESRTNCTVTIRQLKSDGTPYSKTTTCKINKRVSEIHGAEVVRPEGSYSMCPQLVAKRGVEHFEDMVALGNAFRLAYNDYYDNGEDRDFDQMFERGKELLDDESLIPVLSDFARYRHDLITSDREVAAFAKAYTKLYA